MDRTTVITDASFCPDTRAAGWAAWVTINEGEEVTRLKRFGQFKAKPKDANEAEIWALENGIYLAKTYGTEPILAQSDSMTAIKQLRIKHSKVRFRHVKGHTSRKEARFWVNRWCDSNAKSQMKKQRKELGNA